MARDYTTIVKLCLTPLIQKYNLTSIPFDKDEMFLMGKGFALYAFVNWKEFYSDLWYVTIDDNGVIRTYSLMYLEKERITQDDRNQYLIKYGMPKTFDEKVFATYSIICIGYQNHCQDILSGDKQWLQNYPDKGYYNPQIAKFLAPYFRQQGYNVKLIEE